MDPNACWRRLIDALQRGDMKEAEDAAADLAFWVSRGGLCPQGLLLAMDDLQWLRREEFSR